jgi:4-hydroxy-tetrahydrodipicolinate reductase
MAIDVVVNGALGRMGREVLSALSNDPELNATGAADIKAEADNLPVTGRSGSIPLSANLGTILERTKPQVVVDFSVAEATMPAVRQASRYRVNMVIGTTGLSPENLEEIDRLARAGGVGAIAAPNFALGAVLMVHLAKTAARFFDYAEIIELHHEQKVDAPSGTALSTARAMAEARGKPFLYPKTAKESLPGTRGGELDGVAIHSTRLPGLMAHQEVIFGISGQTLTIRHDAINRECYMPGVVLAIKKVVGTKGLTYGLENILGL